MSEEQAFEYFDALKATLVLEKNQCDKAHLAKMLGIDEKSLAEVIEYYNAQSQKKKSPLLIKSLENDYIWTIDKNYQHPLVEYYRKKKKKLSQASLETLSIIAYKQPISKAKIDHIRNANSANAVKLLQEENLIKGEIEKNAPGHPFYYRTTQKFLDFFAINAIDQLPPLEEIKNYPFLEE